MPITAAQILALLAERHSGDVFVPECKDGPTHTAQHVRLDAWAMPRSWKNLHTIGYEIKTSRRDFVADNKWPSYLPLCHRLYFVAPPGVVRPEEVPDQCGLLQVATTGSRLFIKKKAPLREIETPHQLYQYVLMCRADIRGERTERSREEYWRAWLANKNVNKNLGYAVSRRIREIVEDANRRAQSAESRMRGYDEAIKELRAAGFDPERVDVWSVKRRLRELRGDNLMKTLEEARSALSNAMDALRVDA